MDILLCLAGFPDPMDQLFWLNSANVANVIAFKLKSVKYL